MIRGATAQRPVAPRPARPAMAVGGLSLWRRRPQLRWSGWFVFVAGWFGLSLFHIRSRQWQAGALRAAGALAGQPPDTPATYASVRGLVVHRYQASIR